MEYNKSRQREQKGKTSNPPEARKNRNDRELKKEKQAIPLRRGKTEMTKS